MNTKQEARDIVDMMINGRSIPALLEAIQSALESAGREAREQDCKLICEYFCGRGVPAQKMGDGYIHAVDMVNGEKSNHPCRASRIRVALSAGESGETKEPCGKFMDGPVEKECTLHKGHAGRHTPYLMWPEPTSKPSDQFRQELLSAARAVVSAYDRKVCTGIEINALRLAAQHFGKGSE